MEFKARKESFEQNKIIYEQHKLTFLGIPGYDVYNCSIPFTRGGKRYIYGRVERREEWARSRAMLFEETGLDEWTLVKDSPVYQLEDPFITKIGDEIVLGGTHVRMRSGKIDTYYGYFYRGTDLNDMYYFTTGPDRMKDIRLIQLADGRIGVFSRPRTGVYENGATCQIGFTVIDSLEELTDEVIESAPGIHGLFNEGEWGGVNQAYLLEDGKIGVIGHASYMDEDADGIMQKVYVNCAFTFDPECHEMSNFKIIGTRSCYPDGPAKKPDLKDCTFTSGIVFREDGKVDLYGGVCDIYEGRIVIDDPFKLTE